MLIALGLALLLQDGLIATPEPGWPQWRGPRRDGVSDERGLLESWPEKGPALLWKSGDIGRGWSSPIIAGTPRRIFITGDVGEDLVLYALDLNGRPLWRAKNGASWTGSYPGARACPVYRAGRLYHMNAHGRVACFDAADGRELWAVDMPARFEGGPLTWAYSECLLLDGNRLIVTPGGKKAFFVALEAETGATVWSGEALPNPEIEKTGYASPILIRWGGRRMLINLALRSVVGADADTGRLLWTFGKTTRYDASAATPVWTGAGLFHQLPMRGSGAVLLSLSPEGDGVRVEKRWEHRLDSCNGGAVSVKGKIFGSGYDAKAWFRLDAATGAEEGKWEGQPRGTLIHAEERLYALAESGDVALLKETLEPAGRFRLTTEKRSDVWAHPVILDGRLYLRDHETLYCFDIRR